MRELPTEILILHDYVHIICSFRKRIADDRQKYDSTIIAKATTSKFRAKQGANLTVSGTVSFDRVMQLFNEATPAVLQAAFKENLFAKDLEVAKRTIDTLEAITTLTSVFHRSTVTAKNLSELRIKLKKVNTYLSNEFKNAPLCLAAEELSKNFLTIMEGLTTTYHDESFASFRVTQDLHEAFFKNIVEGERQRHCTTRLQNLQVFKINEGYELKNDYNLINSISCKIIKKPEETFKP